MKKMNPRWGQTHELSFAVTRGLIFGKDARREHF